MLRLVGQIRQILPELLMILACLGLIWGAVAFTLFQLRENARSSAVAETATLAQAFAESSERISSEVDQALRAIRHGFAEQNAKFSLNAWVASQTPPDRMTVQIAMAGADGIVTQSTLPMAKQPVSIADREHFRVQLDARRDEMFVSKPVLGRVSGKWTVQFSRKLLTSDGQFAGIVAVSAGCEDLSEFYDTPDVGNGFIMLVGLDGVVRALGPSHPDAVGQNLADKQGFATALAGGNPTFTAMSPWDGTARIISAHRLHKYPLAVMVGFDDERIYRQYRSIRTWSRIVGAAASLVVLCLGCFWIRQSLHSAASRQALLVTLRHMSQGIAALDNSGCIRVINRRFVELLNLPTALLTPGGLPADTQAILLSRAGITAQPTDSGGGCRDLHFGTQTIEATSLALPEGGLIHTLTDVTERRMAEDKIRYVAHHDSLTGLANRILLNDRLERTLQDASVQRLGLVCLDLDNFKVPNDTLGHAAGDQILLEVARRLHACGGTAGLVARSGGDEFAILRVLDTPDDNVQLLVDSVNKALDEPMEINGTQFRLSATVGLAIYPEDGQVASDLLQHADTALYQAKSRGRGSALRYNPGMDAELLERSALENDLRAALEREEVEAWFQPRFHTDSLRLAGFEALARWRHPTRGYIPPSVFIPIAEQSGLIAVLGLQILHQACALAACMPNGRMAVNLSPAQFYSDDLTAKIEAVAKQHGIKASRLELEITEGVLISDEVDALQTLRELHECGLHLALDDFGTGYASLSYLRRFPFDRIKLDQSFVQAQETDSTTRAIVETVLAMAQRLNIAVTAEGVETKSQLELLRDQNCPEVQGYLLGKPLPRELACKCDQSTLAGLRQSRSDPVLPLVWTD
ncbi:MAG TPA: EAL domain-containing protein [Acetobacteraceae bacterium]|nr:EAL domain-containing protein [Acetobacteraceae bacterium]